MKTLHKHLLAAGLLAGLGLGAIAQTQSAPPVPGARAEMQAHRGMHGAHMQERKQLRMERRMAALKLKLQLTPQQEGAWTSWTAAMKPAARQRVQRAEIAKLTTPERIDRMRALRAERAAAMDQRGDATKAFYAVLSADQKRVFDLETVRLGKGGRHHRGMRHHGERGHGERGRG